MIATAQRAEDRLYVRKGGIADIEAHNTKGGASRGTNNDKLQITVSVSLFCTYLALSLCHQGRQSQAEAASLTACDKTIAGRPDGARA